MATQSRSGKHKVGKTLLGAYVEPEIKVLAAMTSDALGITITEIILNGLYHEATRAGIMFNGAIKPEHMPAYRALVEVMKSKLGVNE